MTDYPKLFRVRQTFDTPRLDDPITVGSRGIANVREIIRAVVEHLKGLGAKPFIVPAMGSHGGATAEGQREVVESYGITQEFVGCPIRSSMETVVVCQTAEGFPVHFDRAAYEADHVMVVNRVKPHTRFVGPIESGLMKMMLIGLGKREGAGVYHHAIQDYSFDQIIRSVVDEVFRNCNILVGLAVVENAYDQTAKIRAVRPENFQSTEAELLKLAREWMPRLPFKHVDVLLVDQIGKNISGTGMDTNIVGRKFNDHMAEADEYPKVRNIAVRDLTPQTHGNAIGMGMAEFCRTQLLEKTDLDVTRLNAITAGHVSVAMPPLDYATDREMLDAALVPIGLAEPKDAKLLWIKNTLELAEVVCSAAYLEEARARDDLEVLTEPEPMPLDAEGNLPSFGSCKSGANAHSRS